jgi:hypothetical protein
MIHQLHSLFLDPLQTDDTYIHACKHVLLFFMCATIPLSLSLSLPLLFNLMFPETCHLLRAPYYDPAGFLEDKKKT